MLISFLVYAIIKDEDRMKKYNIVIYQDSHRYRTDKFEITSDGIKFIDIDKKNVYIKGKYIIEQR